jgi:hypothetical protein
MISPAWIPDDLALEVSPPAHVMRLSEVRSAENTLALSRALLGIVEITESGWNVDAGYARAAITAGHQIYGRPIPDLSIPRRYRPDSNGTKCNIFDSDLAQLHNAPLPHRWRTTPGGKLQWMSANDMITALRADLYPGWSLVSPSNITRLAPVERAAMGLPTIAVWFNAKRRADGSLEPGHVVWVVATPPGKSGLYVTGAGRTCVDQCPIAQAFGSHVNEVEFYGYER